MTAIFRPTRRSCVGTFGVTILAAAAPGAIPRSARAQTARIKVGVNQSAADLPYFIALETGIFAAAGLDVELIPFRSTTEMIAPLGTGSLDVGGGGATAGLYNAVGRGLKLRLVADKASATSPEYSPLVLLVRKALIETGEVRTLADLKGRKFGNISPGGSGESLTNEFMKQVGLGFSDVESVYLPPPQLAAAFENGALPASIMTEPSASILIRRGTASLWATCGEVYPNMQVAAIYYGKSILENPRLGQRFMNAYIAAARVYNDALANGKFAGDRGEKLVAILAKYTGQADIDVIRGARPHGVNPDGGLFMPGLEKDFAFFKARGLIETDVRVENVVDHSFAREAVARLGPWRRSAN